MSREYEIGVEKFIEFAILNSENPNLIRCPCQFCGNLKFQSPREVENHLFVKGIDKSYQIWTWHGEDDPSMGENIELDCNQYFDYDKGVNAIEMVHDAYKNCTVDPKAFKVLLEDAEKPLFPGCKKYTKLSALVKLFNIKGKYGLSDLLNCLQDMLPVNNGIPTAFGLFSLLMFCCFAWPLWCHYNPVMWSAVIMS
ncbi:hypothetical protein EZV62_001670 [Acer yangbiense]|uniref:Transposase-associated domain-containing protein n=1 Tax=Acer yangbiense TaxID=1000413 RepID=A0A5C7IUZ4_9ROSI|nr:hypothetical protein EZV62_001670 [Acer yangbiense]